MNKFYDLILDNNKHLLDEIKNLIKQGEDVRQENDAFFITMCGDGNIEIMEYLLSVGADINCEDGYALAEASANRKTNAVKFLLEHGADTRLERSKMAIYSCICEKENWEECKDEDFSGIDIVKLLLEHGANIHENNDMAFYHACLFNHFELADYLLKNGANIYADNNRAMKHFIVHDEYDALKYLSSKIPNEKILEMIKEESDKEPKSDFEVLCDLIKKNSYCF